MGIISTNNKIKDIYALPKSQNNSRDLIYIAIVSFLAHGFLLIATGMWWDDWVYADKNWEYLLEVCRQSSLPLHAYINGFLWLLPEGAYRVITFALYTVDSFFIYYILKKTPAFSDEACLWIAILFLVIPVNDARITWICFGYSLGLFMFLLSFVLTVLWKTLPNEGHKNLSIRILSLLVLLLSFDTESNMAMTPLILLFLYYDDLRDNWKEYSLKKKCRQLLVSVLKYADYLVAPFFWYFGDKILFPGYGIYGGHSYVVADKFPDIFKSSLLLFCDTLKGIFQNYSFIAEKLNAIIVLLLLAVFVVVTNIKLNYDKYRCSLSNCIIMIVLGGIAFYFGAFPYFVKRGQVVESVLIGGRDSLLLGIGTSIIIYYFATLIINEKLKTSILLLVVVLGIAHFNYYYMTWQECYYQQLQLQSAIKKNESIIENDTFLIMFRNDVVSSCYYQTNGNSWKATGTEDRYYMPDVNLIQSLLDMNEDTWALKAYGMKDYNYKDKTIDGIIFVDYHLVGSRTILKEKIDEIFNKREFEKWIETAADIKYVPLSKKDSDYIINLFKEETLTRDSLYTLYYKSNTNINKNSGFSMQAMM